MADDTYKGCESNTISQTPEALRQESFDMPTEEMDNKGIDV
jgi:hypothetical protein